MPNQSSAPEKPRFSESTSSAASSAKRNEQRQRVGEARVGHHEQVGEDHERQHARDHDARRAQAPVEAAPAQPQEPQQERQRRPGEPGEVAQVVQRLGAAVCRRGRCSRPAFRSPATARTARDRARAAASGQGSDSADGGRERREQRDEHTRGCATPVPHAGSTSAVTTSQSGPRKPSPMKPIAIPAPSAMPPSTGMRSASARPHRPTATPSVRNSSGESTCARSQKPTLPTRISTGSQRNARPLSSRLA